MQFTRKGFTNDRLLEIYDALLRPRLIEEKMLILLRQGRISKWFSGIGQEAVSVGSGLAMKADEYILPMHRNLGIFTLRKIPYHRLFAQFQGKLSGFTKGRDRSFHFGSNEHHIIGMISHLGAQLGVADGVALASVLRKEKKAVLVFTGDGGTSEGDFHEAVNVAAVWGLPVIFMIENNGYGLSTPNSEQFRFKHFTDKAQGYGIEAIRIDGNNVLEVYRTIEKYAKEIRKNPRPVMVEAITFRMRGHEEASGTKYVPRKLMDEWTRKDPIDNFQSFLLDERVLSEQKIKAHRKAISNEIEEGLKLAYAEKIPVADSKNELGDIFSPNHQAAINPSGKKSSRRFVDAISDGLKQNLEKYPNLIFMGQDIAEYGGVFKVSEGFLEKFGKDRIRNTPLCESAIIGIALGLSIKGYKAVIEMQFADFVTCGFNQIINNLAKVHYRWGQHADVVIRMPTGAGVSAGPFHSQSNEAWFFHTPGLKIFYPSSPYDAKGLLSSAIADPNPVLFFEHKYLYRSITDDIPDDYYTVPPGKAKLVNEGSDVSIITYGLGVHWAKELMGQEASFTADILDMRTLIPWDKEAIVDTVKKTNRVIILHEDTETGGIGGEWAAWIAEHCFEYLDAPVMRLGALDTPVPFAAPLEDNFMPKGRLKQKIEDLLHF